MFVFGIPILLYLIGFAAVCMAHRWWAFIPVSAAVLSVAVWIRDLVANDTGFGSGMAKTMLLLAAIGAASGFATRLILLVTGWSALRGRGFALTLAILVAAPIGYGIAMG